MFVSSHKQDTDDAPPNALLFLWDMEAGEVSWGACSWASCSDLI